MKHTINILAVICMLASTAFSDELAERFRGKFLRRDIVSTDRQESYSVRLSGNSFPYISFVLERRRLLIHHEVNIYQAMKRIELGHAEDGQVLYDFVLIPGEIITGEELDRQEFQTPGPLANETVKVNGIIRKTDSKGIIVDDGFLGIMEYFDNLRSFTYDLEFVHTDLGAKKLKIYRAIPKIKAEDERSLSLPAANDIMVAFGIDCVQRRSEPEREGLVIEILDLPKTITPGQSCEMTVRITNKGTKETSCLLGRLFSRQEWLNGKLFYFGAIKPGGSLAFTRSIEVPKEIKTEQCHVLLAFQDSWGEIKSKQVFMTMNTPSQEANDK